MDATTQQLIYPLGRHIGIRNVHTNDMRFIKQPETLREITAMAISPNRRFLAICERHRDNLSAFISFYDMKSPDNSKVENRINVSEAQPTSQKTIKSIAFSHDSKHVAAIIEGPDCKAVAWEWYNRNKSRIIGQYEFGKAIINKISFKNNDAHVVCTSGNSHWKLWRPQENTFTVYSKLTLNKESNIYTDHCWLQYERMAATTAEGEVIIVEDFEQKQLIDNAFGTEEIQNVTCIKEFSKGFFVASDWGYMAMWVRSEENNSTQNKEGQIYDFIRSWKLSDVEIAGVICMDINTQEETIAASCKNNNMYLVNIKSIGLNESMDKDV